MRRAIRIGIAAWLLCRVAALPLPAGAATPVSVAVEGTQFRVTLSDGRVLRSPQLVGAELSVATAVGVLRLRIDAVEPDPGDPARGVRPAPAVLLHTLSVQQADGRWLNPCEPGPDGRRQAFPLAGRAREDGTIVAAPEGEFALTCTGGAEGKCIRFGYRPWDKAPDGRPLGLAVYNACVRLVRADYAGDGSATTRNGQPIDIYDRFGIEKPAYDAAQEFEAGWTEHGAVCVRHVRVAQNATLAGIVAHSPRLAGRVGSVCTEAFARAAGAILFNRSPAAK